MKVLFDHNVDRRFRRHLPAHEIKTAREMRWEQLDNGELLDAAAVEGFEVVLSVDKNLRHQQNLQTLPIPIVVLDSVSNALPDLVPFGLPVLQLLRGPLDRVLYVIQPDGQILRFGTGGSVAP